MENKYRLYGIIGAFVFHGLILLWLFFTYLTTSIPEQLGGILVNFGYVDESSGLFEPHNQSKEELISVPETTESIPKPIEKSIIAQDNEASVFVAEAKKKEEEAKKRNAEIRRQQEAEAERKRIEEQAKADAINRLVGGAFNTNSTQSNQGSSSSGKGNEGNPFGNSGQGSNQGIGGFGGGASFSLDGRKAEGLPRPTATIKEEGRIVVSITVNPRGDVIFAEISSGTNISDKDMRKSAVDAAKKAKFSSINKTNNQAGTITYRYSLK